MPSTPAMSPPKPLLSLNNLSIRKRDGGVLVNGINLHVDAGEWLAVVGESGSGKSLSALASLRLLPAGISASGQLLYDGEDISRFSEKRLQQLRGGDVGMIFQEPLTALNPLHRIGKQLIEMLQLHQKIDATAAKARAIGLLNEVGIDHAERRLSAWPHELSGGQRQRVMIAMALANNPKLLIADEPTTALDALLQIQILDLLKNLQKKRGLSVLFISHDLPQVRRYADRVAVMKAGEVVENANCAELFERPQHDYTRMLLRPFGQAQLSTVDASNKAVLTAAQVNVHYPLHSNWMGRVTDWHHAVQDVGLTLRQGEALGIVGESGSGKSTLAAALLRLTPAKGRITVLGKNWLGLTPKALRAERGHMQMVFQDPYGSLSPRLMVSDLIAEGLRAHRQLDENAIDQAVIEAMQAVNLDPASRHRYPHEFSGGQRQRIALARALILRPEIIVMDEPTSALDRHTQRDIVELLRKIQQDMGVSYVFISHDLRVVQALCHRLLVMHQGRVVEQGKCEDIFEKPQHAYTQALLASMLAH